MKFLTNLDMNLNELQNAKMQNLATAPASPEEGQMYYNTVSKHIFTWNGTSWVQNDGASASVTEGDITTILNAVDAKTTPVDADTMPLNDSADDSSLKKLTWSNIKATLKTYFDTLYGSAAASHTQNTDTGTTSATFQLQSGSSGVKLKNDSGVFQVRNAADNDYANIRVKDLIVEGTTTTINSNEVNIGDAEILLNSDITTSAGNSDGGVAVKRLMADDNTRKDAKLNFNNSTSRWDMIIGAITGTLVTAQIVGKIVTNVGDGTNTSIVITHNLNTKDLSVNVREAASPYAQVYCDIEFTSLNTITLLFADAPTTNQFVCTVIG